MTHFSLGPGVECNLDKLVTTRLLIQAASGAGKSWALRRILEQTHGRIQHLVLDPEGEFASLREKYDYVYVAPSGGDAVAHPRSAALLAHRLLDLGISAVLDLFELKAEDRKAFVRLFCEALVDAPKRLWHPALVVIDEASAFCAEKGQGESSSTQAVIELCNRGRKRGFSPILATQRLSTLNKNAAAICINKLIGLTALPLDMKAAGDELGMGKADQLALRELEPGEFFAFGPAISRKVTRIRIGPIATTHPKSGGRQRQYKTPPPTAKVRGLLPQLADLPAEAEQRQRTIEEMRAENAKLHRDLVAAQRAVPAPLPPKRVEVSVLTDDDRVALKKAGTLFSGHAVLLGKAADHLEACVSRPLEDAVATIRQQGEHLVDVEKRLDALAALRVIATPHMPRTQIGLVAGPRPTQHALAVGVGGNGAGVAIPKGERLVLIAAAMYDDGITRSQSTILTGYKRSTRDAYIARLANRGYVESKGDRVCATEAGIVALGSDYAPLPTGDPLLKWWLARLPEGEAKVLRLLTDNGKQSDVEREEIDKATGYKRSTRDAYLARLEGKRLVEYAGAGLVRASAELFDA